MTVFDDLVSRHAPQLLIDSIPFGTSRPDHAALDAAMIRRSAQWFAEPEFLIFEHGRSQSVDHWLEESLTHSGIALLPQEVKKSLLADLRDALPNLNEGHITVQYETRVTSAIRR